MDVAEACSGIRSLLSLVTLAIIYGYLMETRRWVRVVLVLSAVPIAVAANSVRVFVTGILIENGYISGSGGDSAFHDGVAGIRGGIDHVVCCAPRDLPHLEARTRYSAQRHASGRTARWRMSARRRGLFVLGLWLCLCSPRRSATGPFEQPLRSACGFPALADWWLDGNRHPHRPADARYPRTGRVSAARLRTTRVSRNRRSICTSHSFLPRRLEIPSIRPTTACRARDGFRFRGR